MRGGLKAGMIARLRARGANISAAASDPTNSGVVVKADDVPVGPPPVG